MVLSAEQDAIMLPDGATLTSWTGPLWPTNLKGLIVDLKFQTITVPSLEPETACLRFGLNATLQTPSLCPLNDLLRAGSP